MGRLRAGGAAAVGASSGRGRRHGHHHGRSTAGGQQGSSGWWGRRSALAQLARQQQGRARAWQRRGRANGSRQRMEHLQQPLVIVGAAGLAGQLCLGRVQQQLAHLLGGWGQKPVCSGVGFSVHTEMDGGRGTNERQWQLGVGGDDLGKVGLLSGAAIPAARAVHTPTAPAMHSAGNACCSAKPGQPPLAALVPPPEGASPQRRRRR